MSKKIRTEAVDSLFEAVLSLKNKEEFAAVRGRKDAP